MTTVPHEIRRGRKAALTRTAWLFATVAFVPVFAGPAWSQTTTSPSDQQTSDTTEPATDDVVVSEDAIRALIEADAEGKTRTVKSPRALPAAAVTPVQGDGGIVEDDPYAATGIRLGTFILRPTLELGLTGQRKTSASSSGAPPVVTESTAYTLFGDSTLRLKLDSDWSRHSLVVNAEGALRRTLVNGDGLEPSFSVDATGRLDIAEGTTLTGTFGYSYEEEDPSSAAFLAATDPGLIPVVTGVNSPATQTLTGSLALRQEIGRFYAETGVSGVREIHGAAKLSDGTTIYQGDLNNSTLDGRLRLGIQASPVFSPFIEATGGVRRMDVTPDTGGNYRNAYRYGLRAGTGFDFGEKLNGEVAVGYTVEDVADLALDDIRGLAVGATINWSPRRETDVTLDLATTTEVSGDSGGNGALLYSADLGVTHRIRANLTAEAGFGAEYRYSRSEPDETTLNGELALTYWFNRFAGMTTRVGHEETLSSNPAVRTRTTTAFVGLRLQR